MDGIVLTQRVPHHDQIIGGKINRDGQYAERREAKNFSAIRSGKDNSISVLATMNGAERKCGTMSAMRRSSPFSASHSSIKPMRVPVRDISMCFMRDIFVQRQAICSTGGMISSDQTRHAIVEQLLDNHMARRFQDRLEPQHDIEIIVFQLPLGKRRFRSFDVNVDARRVIARCARRAPEP